MKEVFRQGNKRAVEEVESVEKTGTWQPNSSIRNWRRKPNGLRKVQKGRIAPNGSFGKCIASVRGERTNCRRQGHQARLHCATKSASQRNTAWNLKSTILPGIPWSRIRSSSWNRNVPHVVFRFWHAQLRNWSNKKQRTELYAGGGQTLLCNDKDESFSDAMPVGDFDFSRN